MHNDARLQPKPHRPCAACGATAHTVCHRQTFVVPDNYPLPAEYNVVCCRRCGFVYADPEATQRDYDRFYCEWSKYDDSATATGSGVSPFDAARLETTARDIARGLPSRAATILDAGCATGGLLTALRDQGFTAVAGLDPSPRCAASCRERGFEAYIGSLASHPGHMPKFDCIVLSHVLEHVYDISAFFAAVRSLLSPGGFLYLETPDASRYVDYLYAPFQEFNTEHINHFSPCILENTARRFGFDPVLVEQKILLTGTDIHYPATFGIFRDHGVQTENASVVYDQALPGKITAYIKQSSVMMEHIDAHLTQQLAGYERLLLWCAGQLSMKLLALPCLQQKRVAALVDNNPILRGKKLAGSLVIGPTEIAEKQAPIIIATLLHADEIHAHIRSLGLDNPVFSLLPSTNVAAHA
jgi:2-polyprenyl-3-methyl-5-hydroxy-6-metoxy-1,4-benzoquinol methylase